MPCRSQASSSASFLSKRCACDRFDRERFVLAPQIRRVVAGPRCQRTAIELDDARGEALEEGPIVRDEHDGTAVVGEEVLEPSNGVDVEMIGRLVEQQQSGWPTSARASNTRRRHPPDSVSTTASAGSSSRDSTRSTWCSRSQASSSSRWCV